MSDEFPEFMFIDEVLKDIAIREHHEEEGRLGIL